MRETEVFGSSRNLFTWNSTDWRDVITACYLSTTHTNVFPWWCHFKAILTVGKLDSWQSHLDGRMGWDITTLPKFTGSLPYFIFQEGSGPPTQQPGTNVMLYCPSLQWTWLQCNIAGQGMGSSWSSLLDHPQLALAAKNRLYHTMHSVTRDLPLDFYTNRVHVSWGNTSWKPVFYEWRGKEKRV